VEQELAEITSVLIPLYNHERFIKQSLDSVLLSDCSKIELLICDDASTDQSLSIVKDWLGQHECKFVRSKLLTSDTNRGVTANLNKLVEISTGEFITILASDDMLSKNAIDLQKDYLKKHPSIDFIFADCSIINLEGHVLKRHVISTFQSMLLAMRPYILLNLVFNWSIVWARLFGRRKKFIEFGRYIETHSLEDRWSALKIMNTCRYGYLDQVVYLYRFRGASAHPAIGSDIARRDFHDIERRLHIESKGLLYILLWIRRLPFRTNRGKWPCR
jgi:glycosyltransferase involved in cell wall biosynthesis